MTSISQLYWILLETDLTSSELYFPADTPLGYINPKRHYNFLKKRHIRQRERLLQLQVKELEEYQKNFSIVYKEDLFIKPTIVATELVSGTDFLTSNNDIISELLSTIPDQSIDNKDISTEKIQDDESSTKKQEYLEILKKKYDVGFEAINKAHHIQWDALLNLQASDLEVIPKEYQDPLPSSPSKSYSQHRDHTKHRHSPTSPPYHSDKHSSGKRSISPPTKRVTDHNDTFNKDYRRSKNYREHREHREHRDYRDYKYDKDRKSRDSRDDNRSRSKSTTSTNISTSSNRHQHDDNTITSHTEEYPNTSNTNYPSTGKPHSVGSSIPSGGRPPIVGASNGRPPIVNTSNGRPPTVGTSSGRPPTVGASNGRVKSSKTGSTSTETGPYNNHRDSPLFGSKPISNKITSLLDRGTITILKKPNRVIIRGQSGTSTNYGDPKDYDDAINSSVERLDNPVYKRYIQGRDYLFYKTESGKVVTIGPVSKIQPLIHKFFLSM